MFGRNNKTETEAKGSTDASVTRITSKNRRMQKVKFTEDRGVFKKDQVIETTPEIASQLMGTGNEGSVVLAGEEDAVTGRDVINRQIKGVQSAKARELKKKAKALEDARK